MWGVVRSLVDDGSTVLLTTQYLEEADALADEITVIDHGRVIAHDTPDGLKRDRRRPDADRPPGRPDAPRRGRRDHRRASPARAPDVAAARHRQRARRRRRGARRRRRRLTDAGIAVTELSLHLPSLDEVFFTLTGRTPSPEADDRAPTEVARMTALAALRHSLVLAKRNLIGVMRNPEALLDVTLQPIIFLALFTYIFGGAIADGSQHDYLQFLLPGILAQTIAFGGVAIGVNLNSDIEKGVFDRFRSLPIARAAPLVGAVLGDVVRYALLCVVTLGFGYVLGFRAETERRSRCSPPACWRSRFALCLCWVSVFVGMIARTPGAVQGILLLTHVPADVRHEHVRPGRHAARLAADLHRRQPAHPPGRRAARADARRPGGQTTCSGRSAGWAVLLVVFVPLALRAYGRRA